METRRGERMRTNNLLVHLRMEEDVGECSEDGGGMSRGWIW
jgi:hypothetical protein